MALLIFLAIAGGFFFLLAGSFFFGHDHDHDHDLGHEMDHSHDSGGDDSSVSIFSTKVLFTFAMCFGAAGAIATLSGLSPVVSSLIGVASGAVLGGCMLLLLRLIYKQQGSSDVDYTTAKDKRATVVISITNGAFGLISVSIQGRSVELNAKSVGDKEFTRGSIVKIIEMHGNDALVDIP